MHQQQQSERKDTAFVAMRGCRMFVDSVQFCRPNGLLQSPQFTSCLAIFSLVMSSFLTLTHHHEDSCGCCPTLSTASIAGLETLPPGDCDCGDCELPSDQNHEHDEESCSICRMVYEHAVQPIEFTLFELQEPCYDLILMPKDIYTQNTECGYFTRGPPALPA